MLHLLAGAVVAGVVVAGCGDDGAVADAGPDAHTGADAGVDSGPVDAGVDAGPAPPGLCAICRRDSDCDEGALCLVLEGGERGCGVGCAGDADCAGLGLDATCEEEVAGLPLQCRPVAASCVVSEPGAPCASDAECSGRYDRCVDARGLGGVCTTACRVDADCPIGMRWCEEVGASGRVCVPDPLPAAEQCAALAERNGIAACETDGSCPGGGMCAGSGSLRLCLEAATGSLEAPCDELVVHTLPGGDVVCAPVGCQCLFDVAGSLFDEALALVGRSRCDLHYPSALIDRFAPEVTHDPYRLRFTDAVWGDWPSALTFTHALAESLDTAATSDYPVLRSLFAAGRHADLVETGGLGVETDLAAAIERLIAGAGGTASRAAIDAQVGTVDPGLAMVLAQVVEEIRRAWLLREEALARFSDEDRQRLFDGVSAFYLDNLDDLELRRSDLRGALRGDVDMQRLLSGAGTIAHAIEHADLRSLLGAAGDLVVDTPLGLIAIRGGSTADTYDDATWHRTLLLVDMGGADTYRFPVGATTGIDHGIAIAIDVGGADDYGYDANPHPRDVGPAGHERLPSDADGRNDPAPGAMAGPSSRSGTARQGAGRLGIGMLIDLGPEGDEYRSLRMSQGYGALGVGVLFDAGGDDVYHGEAAVQGAAGFGIGLLVDRGGSDRYVAYHVSQGFAYARAVGVLWDGDGDDEYFMHPDDVLYWSPQDPGGSNSTLGQGMGFGRRGDSDGVYMSGGLGVLRDVRGVDRYTAGIFAQASGYWYGTGVLVDSAGDDHYDAQWYAQSGSAHFALSMLVDEAGNDVYNASARRMNVTLGGGHDFSVAWFVDRGGNDEYHAPNLSLGAGNEAGAGFFADAAGTDAYECTSDFSFGNAFVMPGDTARQMAGTLGIFLDADGADTYTRPTVPPPADDTEWTQSRTPGEPSEQGAGIDRPATPLGL